MKQFFIVFLSALLITSCAKTQQVLGLKQVMPDEYQVSRNKSLEIPPHLQTNSSINSKANSSNTKKQEPSQAERALLNEI